jgi:hypothetical protein
MKQLFSLLILSALSAAALGALLPTKAGTTRKDLCAGFLPPNNLAIPPNAANLPRSGISQANYNEVIDRVLAEYSGDVRAKGATLFINRLWEDARVNAFAYQSGSSWFIEVYGGMARHNSMTYDGFAAVVCHEVGHHVGGAPKFIDETWASIEGQADYFASLKCLRRVFAKDDNESIIARKPLDPLAVQACRQEHQAVAETALCIRSTTAAVELSGLMAQLDENPRIPRLNTPDRRRVVVTFESHPRAQCRLDTYFQGALCSQPAGIDPDPEDFRIGTCVEPSVFLRGIRPRCWFAPPQRYHNQL